MSVGAGGGDNMSINVSTNLNGANAQIDLSPTGTGHVHIKPTGVNSVEIAPTFVGEMDNITIGATTPKNGSFVDLSVTGTTSFDGSQGTVGQVLTSAGTGATPTWTTPTTGTVTSVSFTGGIITVANPTTTPALTVAGTSGGIPYFSSGTTWATSAALAANSIVLGGGAGAAPATTTTGTGVVTALGVNTGTAGAFVVNGGALGTPSSGTVTNLTGTASININGTVGATTANTGAFTSITASTTLGVTGTSTLTGVATLTANPVLSAGTANGVAYLNGSKSLTSGTGLVFDGTNLGVGVTPSAWGIVKAVQIGQSGAIISSASTIDTYLSSNYYTDGVNNKYISNGFATAYNLSTVGSFIWYIAPSGTAGNNISFTAAMVFNASGNLGIGTTSPSASAILDAQSTTKGVRMPNMTTTQKNAISSPAAGLMVFDTTLSKLCVYSGAAWQTITSI
jgi:hypothetical protein